jgi:hypothetical protein
MDVQICVVDFVRKHIDDWNFSALSKSNTKLAIELSIEFPEKAWDFNTISWGLKSVDPVMRQRVFEFAVANPHRVHHRIKLSCAKMVHHRESRQLV